MKRRTRKTLNRLVCKKVKLSAWERMQLNYVRETLKIGLYAYLKRQPKTTIDELKEFVLDHLIKMPAFEFIGWDEAKQPDRTVALQYRYGGFFPVPELKNFVFVDGA